MSDRKPIQRFHQVLCVGVPTNGASAGWRVHVVNQRITLGSCSCCLRPIKCISGPASVVASWLSAIVMLSPTCDVQQLGVSSNSPCNNFCRTAECTAQQNALHTQLQAWCALWRVSTRKDEKPICQDVRYMSEAGKISETCLTKKVAIVRCCSNTFKSLVTLAFAAACTPFHYTFS